MDILIAISVKKGKLKKIIIKTRIIRNAFIKFFPLFLYLIPLANSNEVTLSLYA